jgi:hypothetical protein
MNSEKNQIIVTQHYKKPTVTIVIDLFPTRDDKSTYGFCVVMISCDVLLDLEINHLPLKLFLEAIKGLYIFQMDLSYSFSSIIFYPVPVSQGLYIFQWRLLHILGPDGDF